MGTMPDPVDNPIRKTVTLPGSVWDRVAAMRFDHRISTEAEAVRRIVVAGLEAHNKAPNGHGEV